MTASEALRRHWPEYLMEAAGLGIFMLAACSFAVLLGHPASPLYSALPSPIALPEIVTGLGVVKTLR